MMIDYHSTLLGTTYQGEGLKISVVKGVTTGSTNQKAGYRSRDPNGPISVQNEIM